MQYPIISLIIYFQYQTLCPNTRKCFLKEKWTGNSPFCCICPIEAPSVSVLEFYISLFCHILLGPRAVFLRDIIFLIKYDYLRKMDK